MCPQCLAIGEQKVERAVLGNFGHQLAQCECELGHRRHAGVRFGQLLHQPTKRLFAVGVAHGLEAAVQGGAVVFQIAVVRKHPIAAPQLAHKGVAVFQCHHALGGFADVGNDVATFDRVLANQLSHGRVAGGQVVDEMAQTPVLL